MPWNGSAPNQTFGRTDGTRTGDAVWQDADAAGVDIIASDHDTHDEDIADGLNLALLKNGGNTATADIPMGGFTLTGLAAAGANAEPVILSQFHSLLATHNPGLLHGLTLSNGTDATNDIDIATGFASDDGGNRVMQLSSAITKQLDAAWAVGTNMGGLDTGSIADTTYHVWLIRRSDTGVVDVLFSTSASSPTMPANYDQKRRIGAIVRASSSILAFSQLGDMFLWDDPPLDHDDTTTGTSAVTATLTVPTGIQVVAIVNAHSIEDGSGYAVYLSSPDVSDEASSTAAAPLGQLIGEATGRAGGQIFVRTNTSGQIRTRASVDVDELDIATIGWIDYRGRLY